MPSPSFLPAPLRACLLAFLPAHMPSMLLTGIPSGVAEQTGLPRTWCGLWGCLRYALAHAPVHASRHVVWFSNASPALRNTVASPPVRFPSRACPTAANAIGMGDPCEMAAPIISNANGTGGPSCQSALNRVNRRRIHSSPRTYQTRSCDKAGQSGGRAEQECYRVRSHEFAERHCGEGERAHQADGRLRCGECLLA